MPNPRFECQHKVCQSCHYLGKDKSWLSLDGIVNGDILPSVATAFSFSHLGYRPVSDIEVARGLGCRPVPLVRILLLRPPGVVLEQ